jgi:hypothetical protein
MDEAHQKLTLLLGERMEKLEKPTFNVVMDDLISQRSAKEKTV